jgi:cation transport regulator ChaB
MFLSVVWECRYMKNVADVLEGIRHQLPTHAAPIARDLQEAVEKAHEKVSKYQNRGQVEGVWKAREESVRHSPPHTHHLRDITCADVAQTVR